jgi:probable rRNA maturation factor
MRSEMSKIQFHFLEPVPNFKHRTALKKYILSIIKAEGYELQSLNYIFCSDNYLLNYNQQFLKHETLTDIITFQFNPPSEPIVSDIYISIDRVKENASLFNVSFINELHRVVFHGVLHLCGFRDKSKKEKAEMRLKEGFYLSRYFVPRETI